MKTQHDTSNYAVALSILSSPGRSGLWRDFRSFGPGDLFGRIGGDAAVQAHVARRYPGSPLEAAAGIASEARLRDVRILSFWDDAYPARLREIFRPPLVLYVRGDPCFERTIAIVGTRDADPRSSAVCRRLATELSAAGLCVVSGMAVGIDREAHLGALQAGRRTIGVLANGIDVHYPRSNTDVYRAIAGAAGCGLISEYPPGIIADRWTFVRRNRIISGLSHGVVVVKAGEKSGALITAGYAVEQDREVFACPGSAFDAGYAGCHRLIQNGARLVADTRDVLSELNGLADENLISPASTTAPSCATPPARQPDTNGANPPAGGAAALTDVERAVVELVMNGLCDIDNLIRTSGFATARVTEALIMLEMSGYIARDGTRVVMAQK